jgi:circadian clock protein KaiC
MNSTTAMATTSFPKTPSGIEGLDEITEGGLPKGRPTLICGNPGCGKSLFGAQFLIEGIRKYNEPGVLMSFEETAEDITQNVRSLGFDVPEMVKAKKLKIDFVRVERSEIEETGEFDLEGIFVRLNYAIDSVGAKRVVLDTIESLFSGIENEALLRAEIRRLFHWLKEKGVTAVITGERGDKTLTRQGLEEYVSDCVILLDFRVTEQIATRRLRIVKYRGSTHGTNEYPFVIDENGISVLPITSLQLNHKVNLDVISSGLPSLDDAFSQGGVYRGNTTLITGVAGTAKTILASYFALASCKRGERVLFLSFEESPDQLIRNMSSVGINLKPCIQKKLLRIHSSRPSLHGLEMHLMTLNKYIREFKPEMVIIDPISSLITVGRISEVKAMLVRLIDVLKANGLSAVLTSLSRNIGREGDVAEEAVSSLADVWLQLRNREQAHTVVRSMLIVKSRGMGHSGSSIEFIITNKGIKPLETNTIDELEPDTTAKMGQKGVLKPVPPKKAKTKGPN